MHGSITRVVGSVGVFFMSMLLLLFLYVPAWDALANGKLYYCTDGGTMDFILGPFGGGWVHHPESVAHVVPRPMEQPDEIKTGWSITGLWCLWGAFVGSSVLVSALFAVGLWRAGSPNKRPAVDAGSPLGLHSERHWPGTTEATSEVFRATYFLSY
jgi:hypothetical protein